MTTHDRVRHNIHDSRLARFASRFHWHEDGRGSGAFNTGNVLSRMASEYYRVFTQDEAPSMGYPASIDMRDFAVRAVNRRFATAMSEGRLSTLLRQRVDGKWLYFHLGL